MFPFHIMGGKAVRAVIGRSRPRITAAVDDAYDILADVPELEEVAPIVLATQERFDGAGYPHGLAALEIPLCARIIAVVDAFDLLTHGHPLGAPLSLAEACAELVRGAGGAFDPDLVQVWLRLADTEAR